MPQSYLTAVCRDGQGVNPLFAFLKARLTLVEGGRARIVMPVGMYLCQGGGMIAGGILATLADESMAHAVMSGLKSGQGTVTAEMNIRYLRAANPADGGDLTADARVIKSGGALCFAEAAVTDGRGRLLATAGGTFFVLRKKEE